MATTNHYYGVLTPVQRADPIEDPKNNVHWTNFFRQRRNMELARHEGNSPPPTCQNAEGRRLWWGVPGAHTSRRDDHFAAGGARLTYPTLRGCRGGHRVGW